MTKDEERRLLDAFDSPAYIEVGPWMFEWDYPGNFAYIHTSGKRKVYFTPDWELEGYVSIQVLDAEGEPLHSDEVPFTSMRPEDLFAIVKPYLMRGYGRKDWDPREAKMSGPKGLEIKISPPTDEDPLSTFEFSYPAHGASITGGFGSADALGASLLDGAAENAGKCILEDGRDAAWIDDLHVESQYQGRGIGKKLLKVALDALYEKGVEQVWLHVKPYSPEKHDALVRFYEQFGFSVVSGECQDEMEIMATSWEHRA